MSLVMTDILINTTIANKYSFKFLSLVFVTNQSKTRQSCHFQKYFFFSIKSGIFTFVRLILMFFWLTLNVKMQHKELFWTDSVRFSNDTNARSPSFRKGLQYIFSNSTQLVSCLQKWSSKGSCDSTYALNITYIRGMSTKYLTFPKNRWLD
jgi:hypothetical protein